MATMDIMFQKAVGNVFSQVQVLPGGTAVPGGFTKIGSFAHDPANEHTPEALESSINHVVVQHVQDALYHQNPSVQNLQLVKITSPGQVTAIHIMPTTLALKVGASAKIQVEVDPPTATDTGVTWVSTVPAKATVDNTGKVTGVAAGSSAINVTTVDGAKVATCAVTVS